MGKFKKGDEVRLIKSEDYNGHGRYGKTGEIGTVIRYDRIDDTYSVDFSESGQWWAKASNLEPSAATIKIEAGKFYRTRDGRKVGPMAAWHGLGSNEYRWTNIDDPEVGRLWREDGTSGRLLPEQDIIAEWIDEPVAKPSNDNAQPKFKVGDRVEITANDNYRVSFVGSFGTVKAAPANSAAGFRVELDDGREFPFWPSEMTVRASSTPTPTTTIVALIENGQPKPSSTPHVHASTDSAEKEAKRLAAKYKGKQFGVFTLATTHEEAAPVYDHKWQNMAALGLKIDAIKELRAVAGLTLKGAKDAVEAWIEYEQAA